MSHFVDIINSMTNATDGDIRGVASDLFVQEGVKDTTNHYSVTEKSTPDMSVDVSTGIAYVENDSHTEFSGNLKFWRTILDASVNKAISSNSSGSTRVDLVTIKIDTAATPDANASNVASVFIVEGTPGSGAPALPSNHLKLAEVSVADGATSITNANITDSRTAGKISVSNLSITQAKLNTEAIGKTTAKARAHRSGAQVIATGSAVKVQLETEDYDTGSNFDNATNYRFTAPVTGIYQVNAKVTFQGGAASRRIAAIHKNGTAITEDEHYATVSQIESAHVSDVISLTATDYLELFATQTTGGNLSLQVGSKYTYMSIHLLST